MTATNHALTGTAIGLLIADPLIALPAALASHYLLDMIPHFGSTQPDITMKSKKFHGYLIIEALICLLIVLSLFIFRPLHWQLAALCAFVAASPDLLIINRFVKRLKDLPYKGNFYSKLASSIQWFEKPVGALVELAWFFMMVILLIPLIARN